MMLGGDNISTVEVVRYSGGCSVQWRLFRTVGANTVEG